ncbi:hypothetical protein [Piscinibacter gummiphilus]|uniref:Uncharacterized protein n=1 Tax=Piscinibacter gummiphilus TaxID=946333 RepID=A0ABZ0D2U5_9BURK|nr:hypothetical protein [Piscinibacter gummiphilus]WOB11121.1 hypothetical protein RXV79_27160 [Piscinibacter gummiphilus]
MMQTRSSVLLAAAVAIALPAVSWAVSLRPNKPTDDTICDLGPNTTGNLGSLVFVPGNARVSDQADLLFRVGAGFVSSRCADGQTLVVHGDAARQLDQASLEKIAHSACASSTVVRTSVPFTTNLNRMVPGFELRCPISKQKQLADDLARLNQEESVEALAKRLASRRDAR